jgi:hypothetical protein
MDSSAVWKRPLIRSTNALTADSVNGVLIRDAAGVLIRVDTTERPRKEPDRKGKMNLGEGTRGT